MGDEQGVALSEREWSTLVERIRARKVTPIIGAGACAGILPDGKSMALQLAKECEYPLRDPYDLARVSQYVALTEDAIAPKERVAAILRERVDAKKPDLRSPTSPHGLLADFRLPLYITTNYDHLMSVALASRGVDVEIDVPRWDFRKSERDEKPHEVSTSKTLVYHLHGHWDDPQSMVLTEDDYLDFMLRLAETSSQVKDKNSSATAFLPPRIPTALAGTCLLFMGYSMSDWNFRVFLRGLVAGIPTGSRYGSVAVQLPPGDLSEGQRLRVQRYLAKYLEQLGGLKSRIYWGEIQMFTSELRRRVFPEVGVVTP